MYENTRIKNLNKKEIQEYLNNIQINYFSNYIF